MDRQPVVGKRGHAQTGPAGRIELLDHRLHVARRLVGQHVAAGGRDGDDLPLGLEQGQRHGDGIIDAGIDVQDDFLGDHPCFPSERSAAVSGASNAAQAHGSQPDLLAARGRLGAPGL